MGSIICSPPRAEWDSLRQPLTKGERWVAGILLEQLHSPWEVYLQPHLNGLMPDIVLIHPTRGVVVLEVKDWTDRGPDPRRLSAAISTAKLRVQEVSELYCPDLGYRYWFRVAHRIVLPYLSRMALTGRARALDAWTPGEFITSEDITEFGYAVGRVLPREDEAVLPEAVADLRNWLREPEFVRDQRTPLRMDDRQRRLVNEDPARRIIHGPAGSGKSQVLAARASKLAREGRRVLVLSYNITLLNYLRDLAVRWPDPQLPTRPIRDNVVWLNFHQWAKRYCIDAGAVEAYNQLWSNPDAALEEGVADLLGRVLEESGAAGGSFDAILVDEAQDFAYEWLSALPEALSEGGELWLSVDLTQDIYQRGETWPTKPFSALGFQRPAKLVGSHRLDREVAEYAAAFAREFLRDTYVEVPDEPVEPTLELRTSPPSLKWVQVGPEADLVEIYFEEIWRQLPRVRDPAIAELTFLCATHELGLAVVKRLEAERVRVRHTFDPDGNPARSQKMAFFKGDARVKGTTIHSFKGWESRLLVIETGARAEEDSRRAVYTGLTRLLKSRGGSALTVLCRDPGLEEFGRTWPEFMSV